MSKHGSPERDALARGAFDVKRFFELAGDHGHNGRLGVVYRDHGPDWAEVALPFNDDLVGVPEDGILASGAIVSLVDVCSGGAVWQKLGRFEPIVTVDLRLDYLRPAFTGDTVVARMECYKLTRSIAFVRGVAHTGDADHPVANVTGTFMLRP